jgi:DNA-directed RNA polymerase subunit RPC12/RpoP
VDKSNAAGTFGKGKQVSMKCIECGKTVSNWPAWLERTHVVVRCTNCSNALPTALNRAPKQTDPGEAASSGASARG